MIDKRKNQIILALLLICVFLFQNCATIVRGSSQKIPVTSNPSEAKIIVDGKEIGYTPLNIKLKKKKSHVIRIEKQSYNPLEIKITRKISNSLIISICGNYLLSGGTGILGFLCAAFFIDPLLNLDISLKEAMVVGFFIGWGCGILKDFLSGANYFLSPKELNVTLTKVEANPQPNFIEIEAEQFQNIKWIRIRCADNGKKN